jgi:hypothetical protein
MAILFRHTDAIHGFTWESPDQPQARWHGEGSGPAQYLASTPEAAWAEFLRHEEITDPDELPGVVRRVWAIEVPDELLKSAAEVRLPERDLRGGEETYATCQAEAERLRSQGHVAIRALSAALDDARGWRSTGFGLAEGIARPAETIVVYGTGADWTGWMCHDTGTCDPSLLTRVRPLWG